MRPWKLQELRYSQIRELDFETAVLPISSVEAHNLHLPYGTDFYQIEAVADKACETAASQGAKVVRLPGIPYGIESNLEGFPLSIHVQQSTLDRIVEDIVRSLERDGVKKLLILNGHGGNSFKGCVRDLLAKYEVFIAVADFWMLAPEVHKDTFEKPGEHADEMETSLCLHLVPELVKMEEADDGFVRKSVLTALNKKRIWTPRPFSKLTTNSGAGHPKLATAEKGKRFFDAMAAEIAEFLVELSNAPHDDLFPFTGDHEEIG